jgi:DNA-binding transcriptional regulator YdaS (Cro superfamily)
MHPIDKAAEIIGSQTALAVVLCVSKGAVSQWKNEDRRVPAAHCVVIERATNGAVTRRDLRPDDWHLIWPELTAPQQKEVTHG